MHNVYLINNVGVCVRDSALKNQKKKPCEHTVYLRSKILDVFSPTISPNPRITIWFPATLKKHGEKVGRVPRAHLPRYSRYTRSVVTVRGTVMFCRATTRKTFKEFSNVFMIVRVIKPPKFANYECFLTRLMSEWHNGSLRYIRCFEGWGGDGRFMEFKVPIPNWIRSKISTVFRKKGAYP